jgi:hypothetical protein
MKNRTVSHKIKKVIKKKTHKKQGVRGGSCNKGCKIPKLKTIVKGTTIITKI